MGMFMKESGKMIRLMEREFTLMLMVLAMRVNGLKINNTVLVLRDGLMELPMKVNIHKERSTEKESLLGLTIVLTPENSLTITSMDLVSMNGLMEESILETGKTIRWRVMELSRGQMAENMLANMLMI